MPLIYKNKIDDKKKNAAQTSQPAQQVKPQATKISRPARDAKNKQIYYESVKQNPSVRYSGATGYTINGSKPNFSTTPQSQWNAAQYAAYANATGDKSALQRLSLESGMIGTQFGNPYRGKKSTLPSEVQNYLRQSLNYDGPFDQNFLNTYWPAYEPYLKTSDISFTASKPGKKGTNEQWTAYYLNQVARYMQEQRDTDEQYTNYRNALQQGFNEYTKLRGHAPSLQEFSNMVDISKYSKLSAINDSLSFDGNVNLEKTTQILPTGTYYSPESVAGMYYALTNGEDITADRDYFHDAIRYWMNPVQSSPSNKQYAWSGTDLSGLSADDRANYTKQLKSAGSFEEAAAFDFALWAADQQAKGVEVNPTILQQTVGYYKDNNWFKTAHELLGDEYEKRMTYDPSTGLKTMDSKYGRDTASDTDRACYELYKAEQLRAATDEAESEWNNVKSQIKSIFSNFTYESEEQFRQDVYDLIDIENNSVLKNYMNPDKAGNYCRRMPIDQDNLDAMIHRVWRGGSIDENVDYTAMDDEWEAPFVHEQAMETPPLYKETQRILADRHAIDRDNAERQAVEAVVSLADSGAPVSKGELPVTSASYGKDDGEEITLSGKLAALWKSVRIGSYQAKLGDEFDNQAIAAIDPVMNQLDLEHAPEDVFVTDVKQLAEAHTLARVNDEDITLATGIIGYALPGAKFLADSIINASIVPSNSFVRNILESKFNVGVYKSIFEDRVAAGLSEEDAADVAFFAATDLNASMESVGALYEGDKDLKVASDALISSIAAEDGAKDSYEIIKGINDDIYKLKRENFEGIVPDVDLTDFNTALVIGSSEKASPAFRAETNKLLHDIASGYITPEDIVEGLVGGTHVELPSGAKLLREDYNKAVEQAKAASESRGFFGGGYNYEDMPEELSAAINRDNIMAMAEEAANSAELADIAQQMGAENLRDNIAEDFMDAAIDDLVNPDAAYHTNSQMETLGSDFLGGLEAVTGSTDAAGVEANKANAERTALQAYREDDPYNLLPALMAVHGEAESDMGDLVDFFRSYGIWFSRNEVNAAFNAFVNGKASLQQITSLAMEKVGSIPKELVNGYQNTDMLASSISTMRASLDDLATPSGLAIDQQLSRSLMEGRTIDSIIEEYPEAFEGADKIALQDRANAIISSGGDDVEERLNTLLKKYTENIGADKYTPEQIEMAGKLVDWVESLGPEAVMFTYADNALIKQLSGGTVDLDAAGFDKSFADIMKDLDPKWMDAYTTNVGSDVPLYGPLAGVANGIESVASTAAYLDHFFAKDHKGILDASYQAFKNVEGDVESYGQNIATSEQELARQVVSDVTRNVLNSMIGGKLSEWFLGSATQFFANGGTIAEKIAGISGYENIVGMVSKALQRGPFGLGVFAHEADEELSKGSSDAKAAIRGLLSAGIEFLTESPIIDKATTARIGGMSLVEHAAKGINSVPGLIRYHIINTAQNVVTEITQEELSEFFDRLVDAGDDFLHGKSIGESWDSAFSGYDEAVKATAVSTALSTLLFGLIDAGALSMNVIQTGRDYRNSASEREEQRRIEADRILRELEVAYYASLDEDQSTIDSELENDDVATPSSESTTPVDTEVGSEETPENDDVALGKTEKTTESVDKEVEAAEKRAEEAAKEAAKEAWAPEEETVPEDTTETTEEKTEPEPKAKKTSNSVAKFTEAAKELNALRDEQKAMRQREEERKAAEEPERTMSTPAAQDVANFVAASKPEIDKAIVNAGAEEAGKRAVAEDPGLKAKQDAINKKVQEIVQQEQKIQELNQQSQHISNQMRQAFRAAADESIDPTTPNPQTTNTTTFKQQEKAGVDAEASKIAEKTEQDKASADADQKLLDEEKERIAREAKEKAAKDLEKRIQDKQEEMFGPENPEESNYSKQRTNRKVARDEYFKMQQSAQKSINRKNAEREGVRVISDATDKEAVKNTARIRKDREARIKEYSAAVAKGESGAVEKYTDPNANTNPHLGIDVASVKDIAKNPELRLGITSANYDINARRSPVSNTEAIDEDEWKNVGADVRNAREIEAERKARMLGDAEQHLREQPVNDVIEVPSNVYGRVFAALGVDNNLDSRYGYSTEERSDADTAGIRSIISDDGKVSELAGDIIALVDPEFNETLGSFANITAGSGPKLSVYAYNNDTTILSLDKADLTEQDQERFDVLTDEKHKWNRTDGKTGLERGQEKVAAARAEVERCTRLASEAATALAAASESINERLASPTFADRKQAASEQRSLERRVDIANRNLENARMKFSKARSQHVANIAFVNNFENSARQSRPTFYIINNGKFRFSPELIYDEAIAEARALMSNHDGDTAEQIIDRLIENDSRLMRSKPTFAEFTGESSGDTMTAFNYGGMKNGFDHYSETYELGKSEYDRLGYDDFARMIREDYEYMTLPDLKAKLYDIILRDKMHEIGTSSIADSVRVSHDEVEVKALEQSYRSTPGEMTSGESAKKYYITPEAAYKVLDDKDWEELGIRKTKAQYQAQTANAIRAYAKANNLSDADTDYLLGKFTPKSPINIGDARIITSDEVVQLAVPERMADNPDANKYIRDVDGTISLNLAYHQLQNKLDWMMRVSEQEGYHLDISRNSIVVYDSYGKKRRVGDYYADKDGKVQEWFPPFDKIVAYAQKIVCNFPCQMKSDNVGFVNGSQVSFTLVPNQYASDQAREAITNREYGVNLEYQQDDLAYTRGIYELTDELQRLKDLKDRFVGDKAGTDMGRSLDLAILNAEWNIATHKYKKALEFAQNCSPDKADAARRNIAKYKVKMDILSERISRINDSAQSAVEQRSPRNQEAVPGYADDMVNRMGIRHALMGAESRRNKLEEANRDTANPHETESLSISLDAEIQSLRDQLEKTYTDINGRPIPKEDIGARPSKRDAAESSAPVSTRDKTFAELYTEASKRYDELKGQVYGDLEQFEPERNFLGQILPWLKEKADEEKAQKLPEPKAKVTKPESTIPAAIEKAPSLSDLDPLMRISVMRNLRDMGENVDAELSKAIAAYHEDQTKDMSLDEKLDYYAALAQRAKTHPDSPLVDQGANYEAQLMDMLEQKRFMEQSKLGQRLKYITKKAGNLGYKSPGKLNSILKELDDAQKRGFAVDNVRSLVQQNIDALNGRTNPVKDAAKESAISSIAGEDRAAKVDLGLFGEDTTESASASIMEEMGEFVTPETMDAAAGEAAEAMLTSMAEETEPAPLETGFESLVEAMSEFDGARIAGLPLNEIVNTLSYQRQRIADLTEERDSLTASIDKMKGEKTKHRELQATLEPMAATFTDEQRKAYNDAAAAIRRIDREVNEKIITRKDLKDRIADLRKGMEYYGTALANHTLSQGILNNKAAMSPELLAGKARHGEFVRDRSALKKLARDFVGGLNYEYGRNTTFTPQELFTEFVKHVDAETLANDREVALAVNSGLKARKEAIELLKLGKYVLDNMTGKLNDDAFKTHVSKTIDNIVGLTRETGFTNADIRNRQRLRDRVTRNVTSWIDRVHNDMVSGSNIDNVYSLLDHQMLTLANNIEQTEKFVSNYFRISAADLMGSFTGSAGGRDPISKVRLGVGLVMNSIGNSDFHPASLTFDNIQRVVTNFLNGKEGAVFNAMYLMPLMQSNGEIAKDKKSILQSLPKIESLEHRKIVTEMIDQGIISEDSLRTAHPELSHVEAGNLLDWANAYRNVFDQLNARQNVVYSRNGLDPVKRRNNYVPYIKEEQNKWLREMGFNTNPDNLSAGLLGNTSDTTPPHRYSPFEEERKTEGMEGLETDIDKLINQYLDFVLPTIHRTDATIRLNDIIDALGGFTDEDGEYRRGALDFADSGELNTKNLGTFVKALKVYRDMMTNKKVGYLDRAAETKVGRKVFGVLKGLTAMQGAAKVGGNMRPVVLNSIPLAETFAMMPKDVAVAIAQTLDRSTDNIRDDSNFAASRLADKNRGDGLYSAITNLLFIPMEKSDAFVTEIVWRAMYNNCYNKTHDEEKSKLQADKFCLDIMADKSTGNRGQLYASTVGGMLGQFTQEGVNNVSFLMRDLLPYLGIDKKTTGYSSGVRGAVKALTAIILMMLQNRVINEVVGGNAAIDPIGSYMKAKGTAKAKDEDATFLDVMSSFKDNMLQTLNPIDSITDGSLFDTPVPSAIKSTIDNTKSGVLGFANFWNTLFDDDPETKLDFGWAENFADVLLEWAPGGTEMKRIKNTAQTAYKGYVESTSKNSNGNIKYQVQNNLFDLGMSSVFGTGASKEGREYSYGKIKQMTSNESDEVKRLVDNGVSPSDAIRQVRGTTATNTSTKEANEAAKFGEDSSKMEADAKASREQLDFPSDASDYAIQNRDSEWMQKGVQMYKETGLITYPKGLGGSIYETERNGEKVRYLKANNKNYPITPEQEEQMISTYNRQAQQIIMMNDDPKVIADKLSKLPASVKKSVLGGN